MATEDVLKEILAALKRLERMSEDPPQSASARPTEQFPRIELTIDRAISTHVKECGIVMKERIAEKIAPLVEKMTKLEKQLEDVKKDLGGKINGVKEDAAKTATGSVTSIAEKAETALRILKGGDNEIGLEDMVRDLGRWIEDEELARREARDKSRFSLTTLLTILGILAAIGLGVLNLVLGK